MNSIRRLPKSLQSPKLTSYWDLNIAELPTISDIDYLIKHVGPPRNETELQFVTTVVNNIISRIMVTWQGSEKERDLNIQYVRSKLDEIKSKSTYVNYEINDMLVKRQKTVA